MLKTPCTPRVFSYNTLTFTVLSRAFETNAAGRGGISYVVISDKWLVVSDW